MKGRSSPNKTVESERLICVGLIQGSHGVHGQVKLKSFCSIPEDIANYQPLYDESGLRQFNFKLIKSSNSKLLANFECVSTREEAHQLKGQKLFAERDSFPPTETDEFYHADLIGMIVQDKEGNLLGTVSAVLNFGASDILEIVHTNGNSHQIPFLKTTVPIVDLKSRIVVIDWDDPAS